MLAVKDLSVHYGPVHAVRGVGLEVTAGSVTALLGANGAGKTTTLMAVAGARKLSGGSITLEGEPLGGVPPEDIIRLGVGVVPEGRRVFAALSVMENLVVAGSVAGDPKVARTRREAMMERFPILAERRNQKAGLLSGGEQQMLAIARALMSAPKLLLLDEPSLGLAPRIVDQVFDLIDTLKGEGLAILLVEQNVPMSLEVAQNAVVLANGAVSVSGSARDLAGADVVKSAYLAA